MFLRKTSHTDGQLSPARITGLIKRYDELGEMARKKPEGTGAIPALLPRLEMAAYLIRRAEAHADTCMMIPAASSNAHLDDTAPIMEAMEALWTRRLIQSDGHEANYRNMEIIKARIGHLQSLSDQAFPDDALLQRIGKARGLLDSIEDTADGSISTYRRAIRPALMAASIAFVSGTAISVPAAYLTGMPILAGASPLFAIGAGSAMFIVKRKGLSRMLDLLSKHDFEAEADAITSSLERLSKRMSAEAIRALEVCDGGLDDLISRMLAAVDADTRARASYALSIGAGPFWDTGKANQAR
ncbi:MAG: hypothetical protein AB1295_00365 [Candidatus Micrarchaeota archaeon]